MMSQSNEANLQKGAICLLCGYDNIHGVDVCGRCGQSLTLEYADIFGEPISVLKPRQPVCAGRRTKVKEVISRLKTRNVGCVLITGDTGELLGIFTAGDAHFKVAGLIEDPDSIPVESLMTPRPSALRVETPISHALHLMGLHGFRHVPLVDQAGRPEGFISFRNIIQFIEDNFASESTTS